MSNQEVSFKHRGKKLVFQAKDVGFFGKFTGLMFKQKEKAEILLFKFEKPTKTPIHSFFVFFPFFAVWLDAKNKVIDVKRVSPFNLSVKPKKNFVKLIEIPVNKNHSAIVKTLSRRS